MTNCGVFQISLIGVWTQNQKGAPIQSGGQKQNLMEDRLGIFKVVYYTWKVHKWRSIIFHMQKLRPRVKGLTLGPM